MIVFKFDINKVIEKLLYWKILIKIIIFILNKNKVI